MQGSFKPCECGFEPHLDYFLEKGNKMNTTDLLYLLAEGQTSLQEARNILLGCGHSEEAVREAMDTLINDPNTTVRTTGAAWPRNTNIFVVPNS